MRAAPATSSANANVALRKNGSGCADVVAGRLGVTFLEYRALEAGELWISFDPY